MMKNLKACLLGALLGFLASSAFAQSIVGAWSGGDTTQEGAGVMVFLADGSFYYIENVAPAEAPLGFPGYERGTYTWDPATGALTLTTLQDLNGATGIGAANGLSGITFTISGDAGTIAFGGFGSLDLLRVAGASPIVGAWSKGSAANADSSAVVVFLPNGVYFDAEDILPGDPSARDGIEHGTYTWDPVTGVFTSSQGPAPYIDTNGDIGFSHAPHLDINISTDGLTLNWVVGPVNNGTLARVGAVSTPAPGATVTVVEFHNASLDHYFISYVADEIAKLDNGTFVGWARTGLTFKAFPADLGGTPAVFKTAAAAPSGTSAVCRIYIPPGKGDGHFFGRDAKECDGTMTKNPTFILESDAFLYLFPPTLGICAAGQIPVYRLYSNRPDANHRYTTVRAVRDQMVGLGWTAEGDGADIVVMCAPA